MRQQKIKIKKQNENQGQRSRNIGSNLSQYSNLFSKLTRQSLTYISKDMQQNFDQSDRVKVQKTQQMLISSGSDKDIRYSLKSSNDQNKSKHNLGHNDVNLAIPIPINIILVGDALPIHFEEIEKKDKTKLNTYQTIKNILQKQFNKIQPSANQTIKKFLKFQSQNKAPKPIYQKFIKFSNTNINFNIIMTLSTEQIKKNHYQKHINVWNNLQAPKMFIFMIHNTNYEDFKLIHKFIQEITRSNIEMKKPIDVKKSTVNTNKIYKQISGILIVDQTYYPICNSKNESKEEINFLSQQEFIRFASQYKLLYLPATIQKYQNRTCYQFFNYMSLMKFSQLGLIDKLQIYYQNVKKSLLEFGINANQLDQLQQKQVDVIGKKQLKKIAILQKITKQVGQIKQNIIKKFGQIYGAMCQLSKTLKQINMQSINQLNKFYKYQCLIKQKVKFEQNNQRPQSRYSKNQQQQYYQKYFQEEKQRNLKINRITAQKIKIIKNLQILQHIERKLKIDNLGTVKYNQNIIPVQNDKKLSQSRKNQRNSSYYRQSFLVDNYSINKNLQQLKRVSNIEQYYIKILLASIQLPQKQIKFYKTVSLQKMQPLSPYFSSQIMVQDKQDIINQEFLIKRERIFRGQMNLIEIYYYENTKQYINKIIAYLMQRQQQIKNTKQSLQVLYRKRIKLIYQLWSSLQTYLNSFKSSVQEIKNSKQIQNQLPQTLNKQIKNTAIEMMDKVQKYLQQIIEEKQQIMWEINTNISIFNKIQQINQYDCFIVKNIAARWDRRYSGQKQITNNDSKEKEQIKSSLFEQYLTQFFLTKLKQQLQITLKQSIALNRNNKQQRPQQKIHEDQKKMNKNLQKQRNYLKKLSQKYKQFAQYMHGLSLEIFKKQRFNKKNIQKIVNKKILVDIHNYQVIKKIQNTKPQELIFILKQSQRKNLKKQHKNKHKLKMSAVGNLMFNSCLKEQEKEDHNVHSLPVLKKPIFQMQFGKQKDEKLNFPSTIPESYSWQQIQFEKNNQSDYKKSKSFAEQGQTISQLQEDQNIRREQIQLQLSLLHK